MGEADRRRRRAGPLRMAEGQVRAVVADRPERRSVRCSATRTPHERSGLRMR